MIKLAILIATCGALGVVACFLPLAGPEPYTMWDLRGEETAVYWVYGGLVVATVAGLAALVKPPLSRLHAGAALYGFLVIALKFRVQVFELVPHGGVGGRMIAGATLIGLVASGFALAKTWRATS